MNAVDPTKYRGHELLTEREIGEWLGCSAKSVHHWLYRHKIAPVDAPGRAKRFRAGDVQTALDLPHPRSVAA